MRSDGSRGWPTFTPRGTPPPVQSNMADSLPSRPTGSPTRSRPVLVSAARGESQARARGHANRRSTAAAPTGRARRVRATNRGDPEPHRQPPSANLDQGVRPLPHSLPRNPPAFRPQPAHRLRHPRTAVEGRYRSRVNSHANCSRWSRRWTSRYRGRAASSEGGRLCRARRVQAQPGTAISKPTRHNAGLGTR